MDKDVCKTFSNADQDARNLSVKELLSSLHVKFSSNFEAAKQTLPVAIEAEHKARLLSVASVHLLRLAGNEKHQQTLAQCLDEVFADCMCAIYLACCGMHVPARMLLRRSLELGLVVTAYWDAPAEFWAWREHDADISFAGICEYLQSAGYQSLLTHQSPAGPADVSQTLKLAGGLYRDLSNVVHPKTYNFSTAGASTFSFHPEDLEKSLSYTNRVNTAIAEVLSARFAGLAETLMTTSTKGRS
jgi:hypothetical protein